VCGCGHDSETVEHFILHCPKYDSERSQLIDIVESLWHNVKVNGFVFDKLHLVVAPQSDDTVTRKDDLLVKSALFDFCTRRDAILDLVITDEPNMVYNMLDLGPFLGSDHNALSWQLEINTQVESPRRRIFDYNKGDIAALKCELNKIDWNVILHQLNAEESWNVFS